jgi:hypothetical protein
VKVIYASRAPTRALYRGNGGCSPTANMERRSIDAVLGFYDANYLKFIHKKAIEMCENVKVVFVKA